MKIDVYVSGKKDRAPIPPMAKMMLLAGAVLASFLAVKIFFVIQFSKDISMEPAISKGSVAVLSRWSDPKKGDIVLVRLPQNKSRAFFSRVVALGGDKVEILDKKILVNGLEYNRNIVIKDSRILPPVFTSRDNMQAITLGKNEFFVIGDNFDRAIDSRFCGAIKEDEVAGVVMRSFF